MSARQQPLATTNALSRPPKKRRLADEEDEDERMDADAATTTSSTAVTGATGKGKVQAKPQALTTTTLVATKPKPPVFVGVWQKTIERLHAQTSSTRRAEFAGSIQICDNICVNNISFCWFAVETGCITHGTSLNVTLIFKFTVGRLERSDSKMLTIPKIFAETPDSTHVDTNDAENKTLVHREDESKSSPSSTINNHNQSGCVETKKPTWKYNATHEQAIDKAIGECLRSAFVCQDCFELRFGECESCIVFHAAARLLTEPFIVTELGSGSGTGSGATTLSKDERKLFVGRYKQDECVFCKVEFTPTAPIARTECDHWFHYNCLSQLVKNECPICKRHVHVIRYRNAHVCLTSNGGHSHSDLDDDDEEY